jgi:DNA topoisomerase III
LIEAMQNAWRFDDDEVLRGRLKEAKGIGTPATRAEIIGGLKKQDFLVAQGKNIVPTEAGLTLHGILKQADPTLVDPGMTAQLECLLDDVVVGKQAMVGAIDAVCDVAQRIIGKLTQGPVAGGPPLLGSVRDGGKEARPPTSAMKRYADGIARQKRIRPPPGYATSLSICRAFLEQHEPGKVGSRRVSDPGCTVASPAQVSSGVRKRAWSRGAQEAGLPSAPWHRRCLRPGLSGTLDNSDLMLPAAPWHG